MDGVNEGALGSVIFLWRVSNMFQQEVKLLEPHLGFVEAKF